MYLFANYICYQFLAIPYLNANNWVKQESVGRPIFCIVKCKSLIHLDYKGTVSRGGIRNEKIPYCSN
ncbi:hypothetical protein OAS14_04570, partial [Alphaproteobacteria bacterium]|nr:hypothetical protein [Alphaproteobacteria bacterium]